MSKWKCEICNKEFENFHAQGFNHKIYCPLCYFKEENRQLKDNWNSLKEYVEEHKERQKINNTQINGMIFTSVGTMLCRNILDKMKELEGDK